MRISDWSSAVCSADLRAQAGRAVHRYARDFADREQAGDNGVGAILAERDDFAMIVTGDAAHIVMDSRDDGQRLPRQVDGGENLAALGDAGQTLRQDRKSTRLNSSH